MEEDCGKAPHQRSKKVNIINIINIDKLEEKKEAYVDLVRLTRIDSEGRVDCRYDKRYIL